MKTTLEKNKLISDRLELFMDGYWDCDLTPVIPFLSEDCVLHSQWMPKPFKGRDEIAKYFSDITDELENDDALVECQMIELVGGLKMSRKTEFYLNGEKKLGSFGLAYPEGELCLLICLEEFDKQTTSIVLRISLNEQFEIDRIYLNDSSLYDYKCVGDTVALYPMTAHGALQNGSAQIDADYTDELKLFLGLLGVSFDIYDSITVPLNIWSEALRHWKSFCDADSFDEALENVCGIDYTTFTVKRTQALELLANVGHIIWKRRNNAPQLIDHLIEWTEKHAPLCDSILLS